MSGNGNVNYALRTIEVPFSVHKIILKLCFAQRYTCRVLKTIQMKLILLCVWEEPAILGSTKTAIKFKSEI